MLTNEDTRITSKAGESDKQAEDSLSVLYSLCVLHNHHNFSLSISFKLPSYIVISNLMIIVPRACWVADCENPTAVFVVTNILEPS